ncbi:MAG: flagellar basal body P-ring formation chaperone FlgA, partial [Candidatus Poribacteria bacterium]
MKYLIPIALFLALSTIGLPDNMKASVYITENPTVTGKDIYLGDISLVESPDANIREKLTKAHICRSAELNSSITLNINYIKSRLKQQGIQTESIIWLGANQTTVQTKSKIVSAEEILSLAESFIASLVDKNAKRVIIQPTSEIKPIAIPYGEMNTKTELLFPSAVNNSLLLRFTFSVDGKDCEKRILPFRVEIIKDVIVASRNIEANKIIDADDLIIESKNVGLSDNVIADKKEVLGKKMKKAVSKGALITSDIVEKPPIIKQGDLVTIVLESQKL